MFELPTLLSPPLGIKSRAKAEQAHDRAAQKNLLSLSRRKEEKLKKQKEALEFERNLLRKEAR